MVSEQPSWQGMEKAQVRGGGLVEARLAERQVGDRPGVGLPVQSEDLGCAA